MLSAKILVIPGSLRARSFNVRLAALATKELALADAEVTRISLLDYPLPIFDAESWEKHGAPTSAVKLRRLMATHHGVFIASPEYNASITPLLKNMIDWISVASDRDEQDLSVFHNRVFALGGASPRVSGALHSLLALRQVLAVGCRAVVLPDQVSVANAEHAFDERGELIDARTAGQLKLVARKLVESAGLLIGGKLRGVAA